ncbi:hypothetical protein L484_013292 [Morus notabilis]|uniref:Uncharacterized protein n=1 Tax=Morus notabilis TaxID=981085 RepID=W9R0Q4_9ROSA|nr:hypothetical protein L484_013292 [Morus notabilis]
MFRPFSSAFQQQNGLPLASHLRSLHAKLMHLHVLVSFVYKHSTFGHYTVFLSKKSIIHSAPFLHMNPNFFHQDMRNQFPLVSVVPKLSYFILTLRIKPL